MKKALLSICLVGMVSNLAWAQITTSEYNALMDLYQSTNGANWTNNTGWANADPSVVQSVQGWYGVSTDVNGNVVGLNLSSNALVGTIPESIGDLNHLKTLNFAGNQLTGGIPSTIGNLNQLEILALQQNSLAGPLPITIGSLTLLSHLYLNQNSLSGAIPASIGSLDKLIILHVYQNQFTSLPSEIGNLTLLKELVAASNQLSGSIPSSIGGLNNLEYLHLGSNQFIGGIPSTIGALVKLHTLTLSVNSLTGELPSSIGNLVNLTSLHLHQNTLSGAIPGTIGNLNKLVTLNIHNNNFTTIPPSIGNLFALKQLLAYQNQLTGTIPLEIGGLTNIEYLHLGINNLTGAVPTTIGNLSNLKTLELSGNSFSDPLPVSMTNILGLSSVYVHNNRFTFSDFIQVKAGFNGTTFVFLPQGLIDSEKTLQAPIGSPYVLITTVDRNTTPASIYRWYKKVNGVTTPLNEASANGHTVELPAITQADNGTQYYYTITNTAAPGLTLTSHLQTLAATTCQAPVLDFQFEEVNGTHTFNPTISNADNCTITYHWDFGDGTSSQEQVGNHDYAAVGAYTVVLTINYQCGACPGSTIIKEYVVEIANNVLCQSIYCDGNGGVGIGTRKTQGFALSVNGKIRASDIIKVYPHNQWADFVFDKNYKLRPLSEVELFIKKNGHLPEIPSAAQVEKEGVDLGAMDAKLLQKIEELTLYLIEIKKENELLKKNSEILSRENELIKLEIRKLSASPKRINAKAK